MTLRYVPPLTRGARVLHLLNLVTRIEHYHAAMTVASLRGGDVKGATRHADTSAHARDRYLRITREAGL